MKRGDVKRAREKLRTQQLHVTQKQLLLEQEIRRAEQASSSAAAERPGIVAALRELCVEFGEVGWADGDDLADVLQRYLLAPLRRERAIRTAQLEQANEQIRRLLIQSERAPSGPRPLTAQRSSAFPARPPEPSPLPPPIEHNGITVAVIALPGSGYVAGCLCGWRGATRTSVNTAEGDAQAHILRAHGQGSSHYG